MVQTLNEEKKDKKKEPTNWQLLARIEKVNDDLEGVKELMGLHADNVDAVIELVHAQNKVIDNITDKVKLLITKHATTDPRPDTK